MSMLRSSSLATEDRSTPYPISLVAVPQPARRPVKGEHGEAAKRRTNALTSRTPGAETQTAALIIPAVGNNKLRHETLQRFMLANDSVTIAIEIPIWLTERDIMALEEQHGVELAPRTGTPRAITGHIDFLQGKHPAGTAG
jgi:hypothetical protein